MKVILVVLLQLLHTHDQHKNVKLQEIAEESVKEFETLPTSCTATDYADVS